MFILKRSGEQQRFDRTKLRAALLGATHKRPVTATDVEGMVGRIEASVAASGGEVSSDQVALHCLDELRELDRGAYLQFAGTLPSSSPHFADLEGGFGGGGSVRLASNHGQSTPKAAQRRELDG
jgi:transcriptional repressor NrdR